MALPIRFEELVQLKSLGVEDTSITFNSCVSLSYSTASLSSPREALVI
jgi:hypothetical protein